MPATTTWTAAGDPAALEFARARAVPGAEEAGEDGGFRRVLAGAPLELRPEGPRVVRARGDERVHREPVARLLGAGQDVAAADALLSADPLLAPLVAAQPGTVVPGSLDRDETALRAVLGQQVSVAAARTLTARVVARCGTPLSDPGGALTHTFPSPAAVAEADLDAIGMPGSRVRTLRALATALAAGEVDLAGDPDAARAALLALPGIGPWTVEYVAMRALGDRDAFPETDVGVLNGLRALGAPATPREAARLADRWRPFRAHAVIHLWRAAAAERA